MTYTIDMRTSGYTAILDKDGNKITGDQLNYIIERVLALRITYIYLAYGYVPDIGHHCYKIGFSVNPEQRLSKIGFFQILHTIECQQEHVHKFERHLHVYFAERGKWISGEYFMLNDADVKLVSSIADPWKLPYEMTTMYGLFSTFGETKERLAERYGRWDFAAHRQ